MKTIYSIAVCLALWHVPAQGDVLTFENDYDGFVQEAGPLSLIDFETLPDGEPSMGGEDITEDFNYDAQGVHFSAPFPYPYIAGNPIGGFRLRVFAEEDSWIIADLITPAYAVGAFFPGGTTLCAFDEFGSELACVGYFEPGSGNFVGIVSTDPIHSATFSQGGISETIGSFLFSPVPEPGTLVLIGSGALLLGRRGARRRE